MVVLYHFTLERRRRILYTPVGMVKKFLRNGSRIFSKRQGSILSAALIIMIAYGASSLLGLLRNRLLAAHFFSGQEAQLDAYFAAFVLPDTIFQLLILGALSAAFIPVFTDYLRKDREEAWHVAQASMTIILLMFLMVSAALFIFAVPASRLLALGFPGRSIRLTAALTRIMLTAQFFFALSSFMTGIIQSHQRFLIPALAPVAYNLGIIAGIIFLSPAIGIYGPAVGVVIGALLHFLIQLPLALKLGMHVRLVFDFTHDGVRRIRRLMPARAATLAVGQAERVVAVMVTSALSAGTLTIFNFARQLYILPINLFGATIGQASFPTLASKYQDNPEELSQTTVSVVRQIAFFTFPAAALMLILRIPEVRLIFGAKQFPWDATLLTGRVVALFALSVPAQSVNLLLIRAFYAAHNTRLPLYTSAATTLFLSILGPILTFRGGLGVQGIAVAIVIADVLNMLAMIFLLNRKYAPQLIRRLIPGIGRMLLATVLTAVSLWVPLRLLDQLVFDTTRTVPLIMLTATVSVIGLGVYLSLCRILKIEELDILRVWLRRIGNWRGVLAESEEILEPAPIESSS